MNLREKAMNEVNYEETTRSGNLSTTMLTLTLHLTYRHTNII